MRWRHWFRPGRLTRDQREHDIDREIRAHLELEAEEHEDAGMTADDARYAARRAFGNRALVGEEIRAVWRTLPLDSLLRMSPLPGSIPWPCSAASNKPRAALAALVR